jgi:rhamnosyltransferase
MAVDILMATYNGGKYLRNQLLSLQQQTYEDWTLWIRDDGSTDDTLFILSKFAESDERIRIVEEQAGNQLGPGKNFLGLTRYSKGDYSIFCDQDDIWFEKKLEVLVDFADENFDVDIPSLVYCDGYGYSNTKGVIISDGISPYHPKSLDEFLFLNSGYQGCSMLFNRRLCIMAANYRADYYMHDDIVALLGHSFGHVYFVPKKLMLWRQHESNVTGNVSIDLLPSLKRVLNKKLYVLSARHYKEKEAFYNAYENDLDNSAKRLFIAYLAFPNKSYFSRILLILRNGFSLGGSKSKLLFKAFIRRPIE